MFYDAQINFLRQMCCDGLDSSLLPINSTFNMTKGLYLTTCVFKIQSLLHKRRDRSLSYWDQFIYMAGCP